MIAEKDTIEMSLKRSIKKRMMKENRHSGSGISRNDLDFEDPLGSKVTSARRNVKDLQEVASNVLESLSQQNQLLQVIKFFYFYFYYFLIFYF